MTGHRQRWPSDQFEIAKNEYAFIFPLVLIVFFHNSLSGYDRPDYLFSCSAEPPLPHKYPDQMTYLLYSHLY